MGSRLHLVDQGATFVGHTVEGAVEVLGERANEFLHLLEGMVRLLAGGASGRKRFLDESVALFGHAVEGVVEVFGEKAWKLLVLLALRRS